MVVDTEAAKTIEALHEEIRRLRAEVTRLQGELRATLGRAVWDLCRDPLPAIVVARC